MKKLTKETAKQVKHPDIVVFYNASSIGTLMYHPREMVWRVCIFYDFYFAPEITGREFEGLDEGVLYLLDSEYSVEAYDDEVEAYKKIYEFSKETEKNTVVF
jgi:hypothetical protein